MSSPPPADAAPAKLLGHRLGLTIHHSPLRYKVRRLMRELGAPAAMLEEDWLTDVANERGLRVVFRNTHAIDSRMLPDAKQLSDEELVTALCQLQCRDRPQILRLAAQRISRGEIDLTEITRMAVMERIVPILAELCRQALKVEPRHALWLALHNAMPAAARLHEPILHWTRLAEPVMRRHQPNAAGWKLVS